MSSSGVVCQYRRAVTTQNRLWVTRTRGWTGSSLSNISYTKQHVIHLISLLCNCNIAVFLTQSSAVCKHFTWLIRSSWINGWTPCQSDTRGRYCIVDIMEWRLSWASPTIDFVVMNPHIYATKPPAEAEILFVRIKSSTLTTLRCSSSVESHPVKN